MAAFGYTTSNPSKSNFAYYGKVAITLLAVFALSACGKDEKSDKPAAPPAMPVTVIKVQPTSVPVTAEAVGQTEGAKEVEIRARVGGILLKRLYEEGAPVKAGQAMFQIDPEPFKIALAQARAQLAQQQARVEQTKREEVRLKGLLASQSISQREYDNATSDYAVALAALQQGQANVHEAELNLSYTRVAAPVSGIGGRFQLSEGALVSANTTLLTTVVQLSPIWVRFSFSDNEIQQLGGRLTESNVDKVTLILPDGSEYKQPGKINFAASQIDPLLGTQQLRATFENKDHRLLPGQFVRARVTVGKRNNVFLVPQTAVLTSDQGKFVYVANAKNEVAVQPVTVGDWLGTNWVILGGLHAGDKVITDNIIKLRPGAPIKPHAKDEGVAPAAAPSQSAKSA
ncbi:MAG TPA: efflux RND transporter periplasmic adaptor subunit [Methylophilaceae bacterium]|nr:efflux RND transporter periplasmic adaptor subunit [Methylophilaceae bacterium]